MMMNVDFFAVGGKMKVRAQAAAKEMLLKDSPIRAFILASKSRQGKPPKVHKDDTDGCVTIDFTDAEVLLRGTPAEVFMPLKEKYGEQISGRVTCVMGYSMMLGTYFTTVDLGPEQA